MEKIYTFTKASIIKKIVQAGSILFVIIGIASFFQAPIAAFLDYFGDNGYLWKSDRLAGSVLIISGIICYFAIAKMPNKFTLILKILGIFYVVLGIMCIGHGGSSYNSGSNLFNIMAVDTVAGILYLIIGIVVATVGFIAKGGSIVTLDIKRDVEQKI